MPSRKFSIITPTFNAASSLAHCLESVRSQGGQVEHLIIDGASTDGTQDLLARLPPHVSPLTRFISEPDRGIYDAMNKGLRIAAGEVIGILNADDFYSSAEVLAKVAREFEDPEVDACYGDLVYVKRIPNCEIVESLNCASRVESMSAAPVQRFNNSTVQQASPSDFKILRYWKSGGYSPDKFKWGWMPPHPTFFVRRRVYEKHGLFDLALGSAADYELMLRFLLKHRIKVSYIPEVLVQMRVGGVSNASLQNRLCANRMDRKAWEVNGLTPYPWTLWCKPLRKVPQYFWRP